MSNPEEAKLGLARKLLGDFAKQNKDEIVALANAKLGKNEVTEQISINALMPIGPMAKEGALMEIYKISVMEKFHLIGRIIGWSTVKFTGVVSEIPITISMKKLRLA